MSKRGTTRIRRLATLAGALIGAATLVSATETALAQTPGTPAMQIPSTATSAPPFVGQVSTERSLKRGWRVPRNPFLALNGDSNLHNDAYQTDAYDRSGPIGRSMTVNSTFFTRNCGSLTFDSQGRVVTVCIGFDGPVLVMLDPTSLATLARFNLPPRQTSGADPFKQVSGGGYFYLDQLNRAVIPTTTRHVFVIAEGGPNGFTQVADYDLSGVTPSGIESVLPDWKGRIWFAAEDGTIGFIDPRTGAIRFRQTHEEIANSLATDEKGGVYIVTVKALYRFEANGNRIKRIWRTKYPNAGFEKPGQLSAGSGTTPTLIAKNRVAITDNANRMHVIVYERGGKNGGREVCRSGVFTAGASDTENSLVGFGNSLIVENNYGYTFQGSETGQLSSPGISRVDVRHGKCRTAWTSQESAPSSVAKASLGSGLLYAYTRTPTPEGQAWYLTAISLRTGQTVFKRLTGAGTFYNDHYAPISIGPTGAAYSGSLGGLVRVADG